MKPKKSGRTVMAEIKVAPLDWKPITEQCPRCYGRGYKPEKRRPSKANPHANGFYARTCPRCNGIGQVPIKKEATYCRVCGGDGWLSTTPVGKDSTCPYCKGTGQQMVERESNEAKMDEGL